MSERQHTDDCPRQPDVGYVMAQIRCPECEQHGWHPTRQCSNCGYAICWCIADNGNDADDVWFGILVAVLAGLLFWGAIYVSWLLLG